MDLKDHIRTIPDFPKPGILFYDISTLLSNPKAWQAALDQVTQRVIQHKPDFLVGIESRGFLVAAPIAARLGIGFAMIRKKGKLPGQTVSHEYKLEYGSDNVEIQSDAIQPGKKIVILDDLLATGGTLEASANLIKKVGGIAAGSVCLIELTFLNGRKKIGELPFDALIEYHD